MLYLGFLRTRMTESPLRKSLGMKRSLLTGVEPFLPLPVLGICNNRKPGQPGAAAASCAGLTAMKVTCDRKRRKHKMSIRGRSKHITSVHISFTFSRIMLQCLSKAFTLPRSFRLFLQLMSTCKGVKGQPICEQGVEGDI
jgi:hypothetical protein